MTYHSISQPLCRETQIYESHEIFFLFILLFSYMLNFQFVLFILLLRKIIFLFLVSLTYSKSKYVKRKGPFNPKSRTVRLPNSSFGDRSLKFLNERHVLCNIVFSSQDFNIYWISETIFKLYPMIDHVNT